MLPTTHIPKLQCFGIMFKDNLGKYYYTEDTNDIGYIKELCKDENVKTIYTEVATETYDNVINLDKNNLVLMHFDTVELYKKAIKDGFEIAYEKEVK